MSERPPPNRKVNWSQVSRTAVFWLLVILLPVAFYQILGSSREDFTEVSYTTFNQELDRDNVVEIEITNGQLVRGEFKQSVSVNGNRVTRFRCLLPVQNSEMILKRLEEHNVPIQAREPKTSIGTIFIQLLPWIILIGLWLFFFRQVQAGGNRAFSFGKSKAKLLTGDTPKVTFSDVAGADEAKVELQEIIEFLRDPQKFQLIQ